jgi:hypothetical protein
MADGSWVNPLSSFQELGTLSKVLLLLGFIFLVATLLHDASFSNRMLPVSLALISLSLVVHFFSESRKTVTDGMYSSTTTDKGKIWGGIVLSVVTIVLMAWAALIPAQKPKTANAPSTEISKPTNVPATQNESKDAAATSERRTPKKSNPSTGKNHTSGNGTQAAGDNSAAVGSITQGPCSVLQAGGSNNQAAGGNCEPQQRHLLKEQCDAIQQELRGKNLTLTIGSLNGVADAYDYAWEFLKCLESAGVHVEPDRVMYIGIHGPMFTGIEVSVRGTPPERTTTQWVDKHSPQGAVIEALVNAHFDRQVTTSMSPDYPEGVVAIVIGKPPVSGPSH